MRASHHRRGRYGASPEPASHAACLQRWALSCQGCRCCIASRTAPAHLRSSRSRRGCTTSWCALLVAARTSQAETLTDLIVSPSLISPHAARQRSTVPEPQPPSSDQRPSSDLRDSQATHAPLWVVTRTVTGVISELTAREGLRLSAQASLFRVWVVLGSLRPSHAMRRRWRDRTTTSRPLCCTRRSTTGAEHVRRVHPRLAPPVA